MTELRKAAEMVAYEVPLHELLEGVPESARLVIDSEDGMSTSFIPVGLYCKRAAEALRQALAQPEQEPVAWHDPRENDAEEAFRFVETENHTHPLYTAPQKREWQGLTDEEILKIADAFGSFQYGDSQGHKRLEFAKVIEAKLKEKNT